MTGENLLRYKESVEKGANAFYRDFCKGRLCIDDVRQSAYLYVLRDGRDDASPSNVSTLAYRRLIDEMRQATKFNRKLKKSSLKQVFLPSVDEFSPNRGNEGTQELLTDEAVALDIALSRTTPSTRKIVIEYLQDGFSAYEVAARRGITTASVLKMIREFKALVFRLRKEIQEGIV